ncbi:MAG TPA: TlpA disulfide reductase family protein [Actinomycetes bacterium]|nr:TlpA disulfide reductase family protein [Actinomycetes bacterium]
MRALARAAVVLASAVLAAGCTTTGLGGVAGGGDTKDSLRTGVTEWAPDQRSKPVTLTGEDLDGARVDLASLRGSVVVVNVWGSWCGPCVEEAPALAAAYQQLHPKGVRFVGIDERDSGAAARSFVTNHDQRWPSLADDDGSLLLAFRGTVNPSAIPTTLVIDPRGRVAARALGAVRTDTLTALVDTVLQESSTHPASSAATSPGAG